MSQLFRALKKVSKNPSNTQHTASSSDNGETSTKAKNISVLDNSQTLKLTDLINEDRKVDSRTSKEEDFIIDNSVVDLKKFCDQLDDLIEKSQNMLNAAYATGAQKVLQRRLKASVCELVNIQSQMKTIVENIKSLTMQISAVENNIEDHKDKLSSLKTEERRTRFVLTHESNKREKNVRNQEKSWNKDRDSSLSKYYINPSGSTPIRSSVNNPTRTTLFSIPAGVESENKHFSSLNDNNSSSNNVPPSRPSRNNNRPLSSAVKRVKAIRAKKDSLVPVPETEPNGITIFLRPINEVVKDESVNVSHSHNITPSTSVVNFSWFNNNQPETHSDTATNSIVSASNSLFVFSSNGRLDDLD